MLRGLVALLCLLAAASPASEAAPHPSGAGNGGPAGPSGSANGVRPLAAEAGTLPFFYDLYTFRGADRVTDVVASFAVPVGSLREERRNGRVRYRFDVTLVLADTAIPTVHRTDDSVFVGAPRPLEDDHLLYTHIEVRAPPSGSTVQRVILTDATTPGRGQLYDSAFPIPDYSGDELMLSDIALGQPGAAAGWARGGVTLALLPTSQLPRSSFDVYYEIYNLPHGHRYATEILVQPVDGSGRARDDDAATLRFSGEAATRPDGSVRELRRVDAQLDRGRYRLSVAITDEETGETARRSRVFQVRGWSPGTTMVAALPHTAAGR